MQEAINLSKSAEPAEVPIAALIVKDNQLLASAVNQKESRMDPTAHAEVLAIQRACAKLQNWRLNDCDLYVTLEPCLMCAGAIIQARIRKLYFAAYDKKGGAVCSCTESFALPNINHRPEWQGGILQEQASQDLSQFFKNLRKS